MSKNNTIDLTEKSYELWMKSDYCEHTPHAETVYDFNTVPESAIVCHLENLINTYGRDEVINMIQKLKLSRKATKRKAS